MAPEDPAAWRAAVDLLAELGSPEVLPVRERLAKLTPEDTAVKLAVVSDALQLGRWDTAQATWADVSVAAQRDAAFYRLGATLALAMGRSEEVERNLEQLVRTAPQDMGARFNYAAVRLWSVDPSKRAAGRSELETLTTEPTVRVRAALELLKEAARMRDGERARVVMILLASRFLPGESLTFGALGQPGWPRLIEGMKAAAAANGPADVALMARWLGNIERRREALLWIESLAQPLGTAPAVTDIAAQLSAEEGDLDRLERWLRTGAWGVWPRDVLTLAISSRLQRIRYSEPNARATWNDALTASGGSQSALRAMVRLANAWQDANGAERALQKVVETDGKAVWAYAALRDIYVSRSDMSHLWALYDQWVRVLPQDDPLAATWITLGGILDHITPESRTRAEALYRTGKDHASGVVPLAATRWRQGHPEEAARLLQGLPLEERERPAVAFWLGLAYADTRNTAGAKTNLQRAWRKDFSAEELGLFRAAATKVGLPLP